MRYVAAYLLATLGGNTSPTDEQIKAILSSVGVAIDDAKLDFVMSELKGKDINQVIAAGAGKLASVPAGGAVASGGGAAAGAGAGEAAPAEEEEKAASDSEEESDDDMGFSLFD